PAGSRRTDALPLLSHRNRSMKNPWRQASVRRAAAKITLYSDRVAREFVTAALTPPAGAQGSRVRSHASDARPVVHRKPRLGYSAATLPALWSGNRAPIHGWQLLRAARDRYRGRVRLPQ